MKKYIIFLGLNDKSTKLQIVDNDKAFIDCQKLVAKRLGGGTLAQSKGVFMHDDGTIVIENSIRIESLGYKGDEVFTRFCLELKRKYNQESVLMETVDIDERFI